jgi:orotate phosphoribosyltransferase
MTNLFNIGEFSLASGRKSRFKIDCDALSDEDIETLAAMLYYRFDKFRMSGRGFHSVYGVPSGGLRLAKAMEQYATEDGKFTIIVDDVWTTGISMNKYVEDMKIKVGDMKPLLKGVIFSRNATPMDVEALFATLAFLE